MADARIPMPLFCSYAPEDGALWQELERHLAPLRGEGVISEWHEGRILPGQVRAAEIERHLSEADVVLLLLSADFLASPACQEAARRALVRQKAEGTHVVPVVLRACDWTAGPLGALHALPEGGRPVVGWGLRDEAWMSVVKGLRAVCGATPVVAAPAPVTPPPAGRGGARWDFFIAHAAADTGPAVDLHDRLVGHGLRAFVDKRSLLLGDDWALEIPKAQREAEVTVVLVSPRCDRAYYQREEIAAAVALSRDERYRHRIVPVYLEGWPADPADRGYGLWGKQGLSAPEAGGIVGVAEELKRLHEALSGR